MFSVYNIVILSGVAAATLVAWGIWRNVCWLLALAAVYMASVLWWRAGLPHPELISGVLDFAVIGAIFWYGKQIWELRVWYLFQLMLLINLVYLATHPWLDHAIYASALEIVNVAAIMLIGGVAGFQKAGMTNGRAFDPWLSVFGRMRPVHNKRTSN